MRAVGEQGSIFLGDIRNLGLLPVFHTALERFGHEDDLPVARPGARHCLEGAARPELAVAPSWFFGLAERFPRIASVKVLTKDQSAQQRRWPTTGMTS